LNDLFYTESKDEVQILQGHWSRSEAPLRIQPTSDLPMMPDNERSKDGAPPYDDLHTIHSTIPMKAMKAHVIKRNREGYLFRLRSIFLAMICLKAYVEIMDNKHFLVNA
jgi:hypothetical protein